MPDRQGRNAQRDEGVLCSVYYSKDIAAERIHIRCFPIHSKLLPSQGERSPVVYGPTSVSDAQLKLRTSILLHSHFSRTIKPVRICSSGF